MKTKTLITADDHPLLLKGLNDFLLEKNYNIIGSASDGREAYNLIVQDKPDIAILDIQMPFMSGIEIAQKCKTNNLDTKIILITFHKEKALFEKAKKLNIFGYILKEFAIEEIESCLQTVSEGKHYMSPKINPLIKSNNSQNDVIEKLTPSEKKIIKLIAENLTNKEIAGLLFISPRTVEKHRSNIISKLKLDHKINSLFLWATEHSEQLV